MDSDFIKSFRESRYFKTIQEFILSEINKLNTVDNLLDLKNDRAGEEAKVRAHAIGVLYDILGSIHGFNEKKEPTKKQIDEAKSKVGL